MYALLYFVLVIFIILLVVEIHKYVNPNYRMMTKLPGPKVTLFLGNVLTILGHDRAGVFNVTREWGRTYRPIFRTWCGSILFGAHLVNPDDIQMVLSSNDNNEKSHAYEAMHEWLGTGLLTSAGDKWHQRRKILTPTFHFNILKGFIQIFNKYSNIFVDELKQHNNEIVDIITLIKKSSLHSIAETAMGTVLSNNSSEEKYRNSIDTITHIIIGRILRPWLIIFPLLKRLTTNFYKERSLLKYLKGFTNEVIHNREQNFDANLLNTINEEDDVGVKKKRLAMLDLLIAAKLKGEIDDEGIREEVDTFMFEGHDTVTAALAFCCMLLANNKKIQQKVYEEIQSVLGNKSDATYEDLQNLKYLDAVIKESMRMYPSVPIISRLLGDKIVTPSGYTLPKNCPVFIHIIDMHYDPDLYPNPHEFNPDRFLPENSRNRHPFAYLPFSAGARNCIGQRYAMLNMKSLLSAIVKHLELLPVDTPDTLIFTTDLILRTENGVKIKLKTRN